MTDYRIPLPASGACPCGCADLLRATDTVEYESVTKNANGAFELGGMYREPMSSEDPMGNVRLFCTDCGQYFHMPKELED